MEPDTPERTGNPGPSLMIVDDDPQAIQILYRVLRDQGEIRFATSGSDALGLLHERPADIVLLDAEMPGMNGQELCARIRAEPRLRDTRVLFVSAHDDMQFEREAIAAGAADFIRKPINPPLVRMRVGLHLELRRQREALRERASRTAPPPQGYDPSGRSLDGVETP